MGPGKWSTRAATKQINAAAEGALTITFVEGVEAALLDRGLIMGDVLHVLRCGSVFKEPTPTTRKGYFKYTVEATSPNSEGRVIGVVVIPDGGDCVKLADITGAMNNDEA